MDEEYKLQYEIELVHEATESITGRDRLLEYLQPYVTTLTKAYQGRGLTDEELTTAALINLDTALDHYDRGIDEGREHLFSKYYAWWARQSISTALKEYRDNE